MEMDSDSAVDADLDRLAHDLSSALDAVMRTVLRGVRFEESRGAMSVLGTLRDLGPSRITDLAERERVSQPTMTTLISRLEREGLVARGPSPDDGRVVLVAITRGGRTLQRRVERARATLLRVRLVDLDPASRAAIAAAVPALDRLGDHMAPQDP